MADYSSSNYSSTLSPNRTKVSHGNHNGTYYSPEKSIIDESTGFRMVNSFKKSPTKTVSQFLGPLQPAASRIPAVPDVKYELGGSDFRCPSLWKTSSFGKQILGTSHTKTLPSVKFSSADRFSSSSTLGPGPLVLKPYSSVSKQIISKKRSSERMNFGTGSREHYSKMYTINTDKRR